LTGHVAWRRGDDHLAGRAIAMIGPVACSILLILPLAVPLPNRSVTKVRARQWFRAPARHLVRIRPTRP
jgi:hypothetical protein